MIKKVVLSLLGELLCYLLVMVVLFLIAIRLGWTEISVRDNVIGLTIGWILWKLIDQLIHRLIRKKNNKSVF